MDVREIRISLQDDAEDVYYLDGGEVLNFSKEFYKLSFVRAKLNRESAAGTKHKPTMEGAVVRFLIVFCGKV